MGRSNYAILAMGLASIVVLSLLMKYFLRAADERAVPPVARELAAAFGDRLDRDSVVAIERDGGGARAVVTIHPLVGASVQTLAREMGEFVWRRAGDEMGLTAVVVNAHGWSGAEPQVVDVPRPYMSRRAATGAKQGATRTPAAPSGAAGPNSSPDPLGRAPVQRPH